MSVNIPNTKAIVAEARWLDANQHFEERPATIREFVSARYLNIEADVRVGVMEALIEIFGDKIDPEWISVKRRAVMTGAIGIGKTVFASIVLPYMVHWVSCLKDPQGYFGLMAGSRIAFMMMSTSEKQALEVVFSDVKARIENSPWFIRRCKPDDKYKNSIRFPKSIWVIPGGSEETRFEGYNILGGIIDEGDSHKKTGKKDYAEQGFDTINSRIESRFMDSASGKAKGILIVIGQMKSATGFMAGIYKDFTADPDAGAIRMAIWESLGWHNFTDNPDDAKNFRETGPRRSFIYDVMRKEIIMKGEADASGLDYRSPAVDGKVIEVPSAYISGFQRNPQKALRDLAGIPPESSDPFIALSWRITQCQDMWHERMGKTPVNDSAHNPIIQPWFRASDNVKRVMHVDIGYSGEGDALGLAMGHVAEIIDIDGEEKPLIVFDLLYRQHAPKGTQILLSDIRKLIYYIRRDLGFNLTHVTTDSFQCLSGDTLVPLMDGRTLTMREIASQYPDGGIEVYSYNHVTGKIVNGSVTRAARTGTKEVIDVQLDNGEIVKCTEDHKFLMRDGTYREAGKLVPNDSIMPLYRRITQPPYMNGYEQVLQPGKRNTQERWVREHDEWGPGKYEYTHRVVAGKTLPGEVIHHEDGKLNNDSRNLKIVKRNDHAHRHTMSDEHRKAISKSTSARNVGKFGRKSNRFRHDVTIEELEKYRHYSNWRTVAGETGWAQSMIYSRLREAGYSGWKEFKNPSNHKVLRIIRTGEVEDVFDIGVNEYHNFATDAGVFVHNSTDFQQQLRKQKFNVQEISVDRKKMPYEDLRDAIYDQRALFPHYKTVLQKGDTDLIDITYRELSQLEDVGQKIDHPPNGSKDVADCMAGVVHHIMNDSQFRRGVMRAQHRDDGNHMTITTEIQDFITGGTGSNHGADLQPVSFENFQLNPDKHMQDMENVTVPWGVEVEHQW